MRNVLFVLLCFVSVVARGNDGDVFTAQTEEGIEVTFKVINEAEKIVQVGKGPGVWYDPWGNPMVLEQPVLPFDYNLESITIPSEVNGYRVSYIAPTSFCSVKMKNVVLPESLDSIGFSAFERCINLQTINLPQKLKIIRKYLFRGCTGLENIVLPEGVESIEWNAFEKCSNLKQITLPSTLKTINDDTFVNCSSLLSISLPEELEYLGRSAFDGCHSLKSVYIPSKVGDIISNPFKNCSGLESIVVSPDNPNLDSRDNCNAIIRTASNCLISGCKNTVIPESVEEMQEAFRGCEGLTSIYIPKGIKRLHGCGTNFAGCTNLESIIVSPENPYYDSRENCNAIINSEYDYLELGCKSSTIPSDIIAIADRAFWGCYGLEEIIIPDNIIYLGETTFNDCINLKKVRLPEGLTNIYRMTFQGCSSLEDINIPESVTTIGEYSQEIKCVTNVEIIPVSA